MKILFFDTETTGNTGKDFLCQLAIKELGVDEPVVNATYKPPISISLEASSVHHITNKMVNDRPLFKESPEYNEIKELFESPDTICVAHNSAFDEQILKNDGIQPTNVICTLKVIRTLDNAGAFAMHKLQYLRYALEMELDVPAHEALADVLVLEQLFDYELHEGMKKWNMDEEHALAHMMTISQEPMTFRHIPFGKYKGKTIEEVFLVDRGYLEWLLAQKRASDQDETDWIHTLERYLS